MTSYLLAQDGSILNAEGGDRLIWDAITLSNAITADATVTARANRIALGVTAIEAVATVAANGRRLALGATSILAQATVMATAQVIRTGSTVINVVVTVVATGALLWLKRPDDAATWTPTNPGSANWERKY